MRISLVLVVVVAAAAVVGARPSPSRADESGLRVIVHPESRVISLDRKFVSDAFLKKRTRWSDDSVIRPVDQGPRSAVRRRFSVEVVGRPVEAVRRYWSQLVFSGRGLPPPELASDLAIVAYVTSHPGAIGYVSEAVDLRGARVVQVR